MTSHNLSTGGTFARRSTILSMLEDLAEYIALASKAPFSTRARNAGTAENRTPPHFNTGGLGARGCTLLEAEVEHSLEFAVTSGAARTAGATNICGANLDAVPSSLRVFSSSGRRRAKH